MRIIHETIKEFKELDCSQPQLRQFGQFVGVCFLGIGAFMFWKGGAYAPYACLVGALLVALGTSMPKILKLPYRLWMLLALMLGLVVGNAVFALLYIFVLTPVGLARRMFGSDPLTRSIELDRESYWEAHEKRPASQMSRPF